MKPKILILENSIGMTGALKSIVGMASVLSKTFDFIFIVPRNSQGRIWVEQHGKFAIKELPMYELSRKITNLLCYVPMLLINTFRFLRIINKYSISLIHSNDIYNFLPVIMRCFGFTTPYVCHVRFIPDRFPYWLFNFWLKLHLRYAEKIIVVSEKVKSMLPSHPKITLIYNELPLEERYLPKIELSHDVANTFLYLSNYIQGKGQDLALEAFSMVHHKLPNWNLIFVGGDLGLIKNKIFKENLQARSLKLGISNKIVWKEFSADVEQEYKESDIVLNFSESESFSITCMEALFYGRPLIASDCGGPAEIIDHNETGILVKNRDVQEMALAMLRLAQDVDLRNKLASSARKRVREKFSVEKTSLKIKDLYNEVLSSQGLASVT